MFRYEAYQVNRRAALFIPITLNLYPLTPYTLHNETRRSSSSIFHPIPAVVFFIAGPVRRSTGKQFRFLIYYAQSKRQPGF